MTAYNDLVSTDRCPACGQTCELRFQMHAWASYDGDATGRFALRTYRLGDQLAWWSASDARYGRWADEADAALHSEGGTAAERCYGACACCGAELAATVVFQESRPVEIADLTVDRGQPPASGGLTSQ